jgi:hypothetical protein
VRRYAPYSATRGHARHVAVDFAAPQAAATRAAMFTMPLRGCAPRYGEHDTRAAMLVTPFTPRCAAARFQNTVAAYAAKMLTAARLCKIR